jgi:hypothetical protein
MEKRGNQRVRCLRTSGRSILSGMFCPILLFVSEIRRVIFTPHDGMVWANLPGAPAMSILKRPMAFPRSVNGRLLGILILGMISWGAPLAPRRGESLGLSSSSPDAIAWLCISSAREISSRGRSE